MHKKVTSNRTLFRDPAFKPLQNVCDSVFKHLHAKGVGAEVKATPVMNQETLDEWSAKFNHRNWFAKGSILL